MSIVQRGYDSSGRPIRATSACWAVWDQACAVLGFVPTIVQGGHVGSTGAAASAGTHAGDAFDLRLWDRTSLERQAMVRVFRDHAFAYWERYESQGFDLHAHMIPGPWASPAPQAADQWNDYIGARNGLASNGADYGYRPNPIATTPPEDDMADYAAQLNRIEEHAKDSRKRDQANRQANRKIARAEAEQMGTLLEALAGGDQKTREVVRKNTAKVLAAIDEAEAADVEPES